ncbi:MAG: SDR family oxidoreductase [Leptospira sp.]|nr:SDR family oxidoreductase [Leptospira sp.]
MQGRDTQKTVLITGATDGIGLRTAERLAEWGANLYLVGRSEEKTKAVVQALRNQYPEVSIDYSLADLSKPSEVKKTALEIKSKLNKLHVLLNNVGAFFSKKVLTGDGLESTFALNHLSYFLLTHHLMDLLKATPNSRIVNTASQAHVGVDLDFANLQGEKKYNGWNAYQMSKLENILFTYELAERLKDTDITVNAFHPGFVASKFAENNKGIFSGLLKVAKVFAAINLDKGSDTGFFLCTSHMVEGVSGKYFDKSRIKKSTKQSLNIETRKKLWTITEDILRDHL